MIIIHKPQLVKESKSVKLEALIDVDGIQKAMYIKVEEKYSPYLCWERSDAFVVGLLDYAMRNGHDIRCEAPLGEDLYYQLTTDFVDALYKGSKNLHRTIITGDVDKSFMENAGAVGTGLSCGIDSLHVLATQTSGRFERHNLTHLLFNNVGSHDEGDKGTALYLFRKKQAENFCREYGFELIEAESNIVDIITQDLYWKGYAYCDGAVILALQKLFSIYYYASGYTYQEFSLKDHEQYGCVHYEWLMMEALSSPSLKIYSEGGNVSRLEKTAKVVDYEPSYKYLNVCRGEAHNCCRCEKCVRTMLAIEALGKLNLYREVFDVDYFKAHFRENLILLYSNKLLKNPYYLELYPYFKKRITLFIKFAGFFQGIKSFCVGALAAHLKETKIRRFLKRMYHLFN